MSAYEIRLNYTEGSYGPPGAFIEAHDPVQKYEAPISPPCVSYMEINHEVERLKEALDKVDAEARKRFEAHAKKIARARKET